jgi:hypothetical protein
MKKQSIFTLLFSLLLSSAALADGKLNAESASVKNMYNDLRNELRIPAKVFDFCEGSTPTVHFTVGANGYLQVLEVATDSPFLEKQLRRSFEQMKITADKEILAGQRFSITLHLNR